jgi:co-chaperonin GroES (HSP10)
VNKSGISPKGNRVLIEPDKLEETTAGGIVLPEIVKAKHEMSVNYGTVIALGDDCFTHTVKTKERLIDGQWKVVERERTGYSSPFARVGDRVAFAMYAGKNIDGEDGVEYRLINDEDITACVTKNVVHNTIEARKAIGA